MSIPATVGIIVISYRNPLELESFLEHLETRNNTAFASCIAVANGLSPQESAVISLRSAERLAGRLQLIAGPQNPGYFGGAALGWKRMIQRNNLPDWIVITNDDIRFGTDFFDILAGRDPTGIAVLAPDIVVPATGLHQNPYYAQKPSRVRLEFLLFLHRHLRIMKLFLRLRQVRQRWRSQKRPAAQLVRKQIYAPHGACIILSRNFFQSGGNLEYPCFLYGEEFFIAEQAKMLGLSICFDPELTTRHFEHSSTDKLPPASVAGHVRESLSFLLRAYYRR